MAKYNKFGGVRVTKQGIVDFGKNVRLFQGESVTVKFKQFNFENEAADFAKADAIWEKKLGKNFRDEGWTWHHFNDELVLVPRDLHAAIGHTGSMAIERSKQIVSLALLMLLENSINAAEQEAGAVERALALSEDVINLTPVGDAVSLGKNFKEASDILGEEAEKGTFSRAIENIRLRNKMQGHTPYFKQRWDEVMQDWGFR